MPIMWLGPTDFVTGDPSLHIEEPFVAHPSPIVTCSAPGDLKWVSMSLPLPPGITIQEVILCYQCSSPASFISQIRLAEMRTPDHADVHHDDPTDLTSIAPTCYASKVNKYKPNGAVLLELRLNFKTNTDKIMIGAVGIGY